MSHIEDVEVGDADLFEVQTPQGSVPYAVGADGLIFLSGDLHPDGAQVAMGEADKESVPWIAMGAVQALFPVEWLKAKALGDAARYGILANLEAWIRGR